MHQLRFNKADTKNILRLGHDLLGKIAGPNPFHNTPAYITKEETSPIPQPAATDSVNCEESVEVIRPSTNAMEFCPAKHGLVPEPQHAKKEGTQTLCP
jgi:hypothetical protein